MRLLPLLALSAALLSAGCSPGHGSDDPPCPGPKPAFRLEVRRTNGEDLPADTSVRVAFDGSGEETFSLTKPTASLQVTFCGVLPEGSDPDGGLIDAGTPLEGGVGIRAIRCDLWTNGAAKVTVAATGLGTETRDLEAHTTDCGVETTASEIDLAPPLMDGGM